jgi:hypothetical protein
MRGLLETSCLEDTYVPEWPPTSALFARSGAIPFCSFELLLRFAVLRRQRSRRQHQRTRSNC